MKLILVSGKRAVGKDTFCYALSSLLKDKGINGTVLALADIPKIEFCENCNLDFNKFMTDRSYKDKHRKTFIDFAERAKIDDEFVWCKKAIQSVEKCDVIVVSDLRYPIELKFFKTFYEGQFTTIRIEADDDVRIKRGWTFIENIDSHLSETGMDCETFDYIIDNNSNNGIDNLITKISDLKICCI